MDLNDLIESLEEKGVLKLVLVKKALKTIDRRKFVPMDLQNLAYLDSPLPIGDGQTISQPYTVIFMLELLEPKKGESIMDIGYGSGWQTALLAEIVGEAGSVYAFERIKILCDLGKANVSKYSNLLERVKFFCQDASSGLPEQAGCLDGIIVAAEVREVPSSWRQQLKIGGRMVYPRAGAICKEIKEDAEKFSIATYPGFAFVPFIKEY